MRFKITLPTLPFACGEREELRADNPRMPFAFLDADLDRADALRGDADALARLWPNASLIAIDAEGRALALGDGPRPLSAAGIENGFEHALLLGVRGDEAWFAVDAERIAAADEARIDLRSAAASWPAFDASLFAQARAMRLWRERHRHCGACGGENAFVRAGWLGRCTRCGAEHYPRTDPAVIVAISDGERLLLGRQAGWPNTAIPRSPVSSNQANRWSRPSCAGARGKRRARAAQPLPRLAAVAVPRLADARLRRRGAPMRPSPATNSRTRAGSPAPRSTSPCAASRHRAACGCRRRSRSRAGWWNAGSPANAPDERRWPRARIDSMFMTLAAVVVALALGHVAQGLAAAVRRHGWFDDWLRWLGAKSQADGAWHGRWGIALALSPPLLAVGLLQWALDAMLYGALGLLFGIGVLFYCWGPRDLDLDVDAIVDAPDAATRSAAIARLSPNGADMPTLVVAVFHAARRRWFGVLFWFLVAGASGAVLYRLAALAAEDDAALLPADNANGAKRLLAWLDWPVSQNDGAVHGPGRRFRHRVLGVEAERRRGFRRGRGFPRRRRPRQRADRTRRRRAGLRRRRRIRFEIARDLGPMAELRDAMSLVWRTLVAWLAVIALFVIAGWVS